MRGNSLSQLRKKIEKTLHHCAKTLANQAQNSHQNATHPAPAATWNQALASAGRGNLAALMQPT
jgi:uncharacterized protein with beta-barrel porin domain